MKKILSLAGVVALSLALAGCGTGGSPETDSDAGASTDRLYERTIELTDRRTVTCVVYAAGYQGGVSCDWDNAD